jgi:uncharacterized protein YecE (DUF72 family)
MAAGRGRAPALLNIPEPDPAKLSAIEQLAAKSPEPAQIGNVRLGTAGWTDKTLIQSGRFYPPRCSSAQSRLEHYAKHFPLVEVDATYYTLLPPETAERWLAWTPESFVFDVKAHPILTGHPIDTGRLPRELVRDLEASGHSGRVYRERIPAAIGDAIEARFRTLIEPLQAAGRLGCVMLQFPPWFSATRKHARWIEEVGERWSGVPLSVEFRHRSWLLPERRERVLELLRARRMSYVVVDEPDVAAGGVPPLVAVTNPELSLVRFHGHNAAGWSKKGATVHERFDYLYGPEELRAWLAPVAELSRDSREVHAIFNNCVRNYAVIDAKGLAALIANLAH